MSWGWKLIAVLLKNCAIAKKMGEGNFEAKGHYGCMKRQDDVITYYFYPLALILENYSINYRMCYLKIRCLYYSILFYFLAFYTCPFLFLIKTVGQSLVAKLLIYVTGMLRHMYQHRS